MNSSNAISARPAGARTFQAPGRGLPRVLPAPGPPLAVCRGHPAPASAVGPALMRRPPRSLPRQQRAPPASHPSRRLRCESPPDGY